MKRKLLSRLLYIAVMVICFGGTWAQLSQASPQPIPADEATALSRADVAHDLNQLTPRLRVFEDREAHAGIRIVDDAMVQQELSDVTLNASLGNIKASREALLRLNQDLANWTKELDTALGSQIITPSLLGAISTSGPLNVPIVLYHYTPGDFEAQLQHLEKHGYTTIDLDQLAAALGHTAQLPAKPIILTFDDGFANQMQAFELLKKHSMKATFYIIDGGEASHYCIGANRSNATCGDNYLNWDQIRQLDASGLITIASHTVDHSNLPSLSPEQQRFEIFTGKAQLEAQLGHPVRHFAYPYGSFNAATAALVREAGFVTAVSTIPGTSQSLSNIYGLYRVRQVFLLP